MTLLRPEDLVENNVINNPYWSQLLRTVDEFDQLMELCTSRITRKKRNRGMYTIVLSKKD